jgi:hypothetical protein
MFTTTDLRIGGGMIIQLDKDIVASLSRFLPCFLEMLDFHTKDNIDVHQKLFHIIV